MIDFKEEIVNNILEVIDLDKEELKEYIEVPKDYKNGDYSLPCFKLAKNLKKSPINIADEIKEKIKLNSEVIEKVESVSGYLNFFINKELFIKETMFKLYNFEKDGKINIGEGKNVIVEYSSPNIAKPFHIGHLRNTVIGRALFNIYETLGFNTISINHIGDYGTQFGKMIEGYKRWGNEYDLSKNPIEKLEQIYVRINNLCKEDESVLQSCRENFRLLENGDKYCLDVWNKFKDLSLIEFNEIYDILGVKFDSIEGESLFADKVDEVVEILENSGKIKKSNDALIVDLSDDGIEMPCIVKKSNGSSIYASRDLATILYRAKKYDYDKNLYVVAYEQNLYFSQIFTVAKYLGLNQKYIDGLKHIDYGMVRLTTGKMSTREGTVIKVKDLLKESISRVKEIMKDRDLENKDEIAKKVGIGAVIFNNLYSNRIKDSVFDWNEVLNFNGETGPYCQYIAVRTKSILEKIDYKIPNIEKINFSMLTSLSDMNIIRILYNFDNILISAMEKNEPSIIAKYVTCLSQAFSNLYNNEQILCENEEMKNSRIYLTYVTNKILEKGLNILGIEVPEKM